MSRGGSFQQTKSERDAEARRQHVRATVTKLLEAVHSVSAQEVYAAMDHSVEPHISPANSGNILALLARQGTLTTIAGKRAAGAGRDAAILYTLPPRRRAMLPVYEGAGITPLTKQDLMVGKARPRREKYVSMMYAPPGATIDEVTIVVKERDVAPEKCVEPVHGNCHAPTHATITPQQLKEAS